MSKPVFPIRIAGVVGLVLILALLMTVPAGALAPYLQVTPEPGTRPPPTAAPYIEVVPDVGVAGNNNQTTVTGYFFEPNVALTFTFDNAIGMVVIGPVSWGAGGSFSAVVQIPLEAGPGSHTITAAQGGGFGASASYNLLVPTPTNTPTPTDTSTPTNTPTNTPPPVPTTPTWTPTATQTQSPTPTLAPITPMTTITPIPVATKPVSAATSTPVRTKTPTPTITNTPGPGTPSVTPLPTSAATATPSGEMAETGGGIGPMFLWGFVLAGLVVVFRVLRVRSLREPH